MKRNVSTRARLGFSAIAATLLCSASVGADTIGFEDVGAGLVPDSAWYGADGSGGFTSGTVGFNNGYTDWGGGSYSWFGWAYSNKTDTTTPGFGNQFSAYAGSGAGNSATYGVAYGGFGGGPEIHIPAGYYLTSAMITNTTYAALSMLNGDPFTKKFGAGLLLTGDLAFTLGAD